MTEPIAITEQHHIERARYQVSVLADELGFSQVEQAEAVLVVSELASNLLRHAREGVLHVTRADAATRCLQISSVDHGPGILDVTAALEDGFTTRSSLGSGLGAVRRLTDDMSVQSSSAGTTIVVRKCHKEG